MDLSLRGKRAVVTAGGQGIGRAIAAQLMAAGARVYICDIDESRLDTFRNELPGIGTSTADVSNPADVERFMAAALDDLGGLDILVNNAGVAGPTGPVEAIDPLAWDNTLATNISSQFYCARLAIPALKRAQNGAIINLSSAAGLFGYPLRAPYAASKWAVIGFTKTLAMELGEYGIRVNAICPGPVAGARIDGVIAHRARSKGLSFEEMREAYLRQNSMHTFIEAQEIAELVLFLCSHAGRHISGQALSIDGHSETLRT